MSTKRSVFFILNILIWFLFLPFAFYLDYYFFEAGRVFRNQNAPAQDTVFLLIELFLLLWAIIFYKRYFFIRTDSFKVKAVKVGIFIALTVVFHMLSTMVTSFLSMFIHESWM